MHFGGFMFKNLLSILIVAALAVSLCSCSKKTSKPSSSNSASAQRSSSQVSSNTSAAASSSAKLTSSAAKVHESSNPRVVLFYTKAAKYYTDKDYTSTVNACDEALKIDPLCYEAMNIKGAAQYYATGDPQQGFPLLEKCLSINPNYEYAYFNEALIYKGEKKWDKSIALFNKVIELAPDYAWSYYGISTIYADRNMVPQSLEWLKKAIQKDPSVKATARVQDHYIHMRSNPDFQALVK